MTCCIALVYRCTGPEPLKNFTDNTDKYFIQVCPQARNFDKAFQVTSPKEILQSNRDSLCARCFRQLVPLANRHK